MSPRRPLTERLETVDRRVIFLIMLVAISFPLFVRVDLPITPSPEVRGFHQTIEALQPGDVVYYAADLDPGSTPELAPMIRSSLQHLCRRGVKIVGASLWPAGPPLLEAGYRNIAEEEFGLVYGKDFVHLGFKEGKENVMVQLGKSIRAVFPNDYYGTPLDRIPLMAERDSTGSWAINDFSDIKLIVNISAGYPGTKEWVQQVRTRYDIPLVSGCTAVSAPEYYPYVRAGQLQGLLGGLAGAAEYEQLLGAPGWGMTGMTAQSLGHVTIVILILCGNLLYFWNRRRARRLGGE